MAKEIELQNGMKAIVDDEDYERVNQYNWVYTDKDTSAEVHSRFKAAHEKRSKLHKLSHFVINKEIKKGEFVWFKNRNFLDFRKTNLMVIDQEKVLHLSRGKRGGTSKYKGVHYSKRRKEWVTQVNHKGKLVYIGYFKNEDDAAIAYNKYARKFFGELCYLNEIEKDNSAVETPIGKSDTLQRRKKSDKHTSRYKGVHLSNNKAVAKMWKDGKDVYLGSFDTEIEAAKAYNEKAKELFGDKAILNDIPEDEGKFRTYARHMKSGGAMLKVK